MSNMDDLKPALDEEQRQKAVYDAAMASVKQSERKRQAAGYAVMAGAMGYGEAALGDGKFAKLSKAAKLFCIAALFILPNALIIYLVF
ncbi:hypothetical protein [Parasulfitobacter algicola]|uniref:Phage protein n=1 Tax=Parasulfitobacter algicola TaxID=2614809 RepID=A0ABX2IVM8_9RHOB|nr:hypothetical protein [Sulfitobacter algicola]NSX54098.1 hypothetical protein [Sulfitobacter algicola]